MDSTNIAQWLLLHFFEKNLNFGVFGHPWEGTMCIFGKELITNIEQNTPSIFTEKMRVNGKTI